MLWLMEKTFIDPSVKNDLRIYDNIKGNDYTTVCLLDYHFKNCYKVVAIDSSKQQALDADLKAIQQINFTEYLDWAKSATMFFIIEEAKETKWVFSYGTVKLLRIYFALI